MNVTDEMLEAAMKEGRAIGVNPHPSRMRLVLQAFLAASPFPEMLATLKSIRDAAKYGIICDGTLHDYCTDVIDKVEGRKEESDVADIK